MSSIYKQERPQWCPYPNCIFYRRVLDSICGGKLPSPEPHNGDYNLYRICIRTTDMLFHIQVNDSDLDWFRWVFDALDGEITSWLSKREG